ncbi:MAG: YggS family pyridoxal phosphate-dependent enzyme [Candidatus Rokubacteria bacterium]|nr:YggS family pyridoxal phosphate-dependent enzyme [Candidatus Rokubacteria bacterium]
MIDVAGNLARVRERLHRAAKRAGRAWGEILLVGVSKSIDAERIRSAVAAGLPALGENRVQEAKEKIGVIGRPVPWHFVGHLQTNKARDAVLLFDLIHSVDRLELGRELHRRAEAAGKVANVLVQVNVAGEGTKGGFSPQELKRALEALAALPALVVRGLMTIPPPVERAEESRGWFRRLRELRDEAGLEHLSMGMSADFEVAVEEGATIVRIGTAIFGPRDQ